MLFAVNAVIDEIIPKNFIHCTRISHCHYIDLDCIGSRRHLTDSAFIGVFLLAVLLIDVARDGWRHVDVHFLTSFPSRFPIRAGLKSALWGTVWLISFTALFSFPVGVGAAIYLQEFARNNWFTRFIKLNIANLAGVPSIVCTRYDERPNSSEHFRLILGYDADSDEVIYHEPAEPSGAYRRMQRATFLSLWPLKYDTRMWTVILLRLEPGRLKRGRAESELISARTAELQGRLDAAKATADRKAEAMLKGKGVDRETINQIRQVYGLPRLEDMAA